MTKYLAALLLWSVIQVYLEGRTKREPVAVNLPINLRAFFESDTHAIFCSHKYLISRRRDAGKF